MMHVHFNRVNSNLTNFMSKYPMKELPLILLKSLSNIVYYCAISYVSHGIEADEASDKNIFKIVVMYYHDLHDC